MPSLGQGTEGSVCAPALGVYQPQVLLPEQDPAFLSPGLLKYSAPARPLMGGCC